jgi:predicted molibdopterin-dependent oxidoreductase YjgC
VICRASGTGPTMRTSRDLAHVWNVAPSQIPHYCEPTHLMQMMRYVEDGSIRFLYVSGTNPAASLPELRRIREILSQNRLFLVVQDIFLSETAQLADVVLPAATWERSPARSRTPTVRFTCPRRRLIRRVRHVWMWRSYRLRAPAYCESYGKDLLTGAPLDPVEYKAMNPKRKAVLKAAEYLPPHERPTSDFPYLMTTGRTLCHFHTRTKTGRVLSFRQRPRTYGWRCQRKTPISEGGARAICCVSPRPAEVWTRGCE